MSRSFFLLICLSLLLSTTFTLQSYSQSVTVMDAENGNPLAYVSIANSRLQLFTITDERGRAEIDAFSGLDTIHFSIIGYEAMQYSYAQLAELRFKVFMEIVDFRLDEVVVSASRWAQSRRDLTSRVTSIRPFEVQLQNPQTAADLLNQSGEVFIQKSQQGGGSPMIRGFSTNRLLISVDGIRMNNAIFRSGNLHNIISIDPFAVELAEVLFGPGSVMYGSDAIGGVMTFYMLDPKTTKDAKLHFNGRAVTRFATANQENTGHFHIGLSSKKWASVTSVTINSFDHLKMGIHGPEEYLRKEYVARDDGQDIVRNAPDDRIQFPTAYDQLSLLQKLRYSPSEKWDFVYSFIYSNTTDFDRYDRLIQYTGDQPRSAEWYYGPQLWMMNALTINYNNPGSLFDESNLKIAVQLFEESRHDRNYRSSKRKHRYEKVLAYNLQLDFIKQLAEDTRLLYGFDLILNKVDSKGTNTNIDTGVTEAGPSRYPQSDWTSAGAFASMQHRFSRKVLANVGVRYTHYGLQANFDTQFYPFPYEEANLNNDAVNGSFGMVYNPNERWTISSNFSTGFRSPNVDDMGKVFDSEPGSVIVPNPNLKAEYARNIDLAIAHYFGNTLKIDATAFYTRLYDAMVRRPFLLDGADSILYDGEMSRVLAIQNAARADVYGIQAGFEVKLPMGFGIFTSMSWQKGEEELDDGSKSPLRHAAPFFGRTRLSYSKNRLRIELSMIFNSKVSYENLPLEEISKAYLYAKDSNGNPYSPAWHTLNLKALYHLTDQLTFSSGLENITNQRYRPYSSGMVAPGTNFIISAGYVF